MLYHVRITQESNRSHDEVKLDLTWEQLRELFLTPYREGRPIVIGGTTIPPDDIERIRITSTQETSEQLLPIVKAERRENRVLTFIPDEWYVAEKGKDVTDELITSPPGSGTIPRNQREGPSIQGPKVIFVVHGRNSKARNSMFIFLRSIGLHPLEWLEAIAATGKSLPYVGEILDTAFSIAQAVIVLMTPDDEAQLREQFRLPGDPPHETKLSPQARPNVLFEAGMAMGRFPDRTVIVEFGNLRPFSDIAGRHTVRLDNTTQRRQELAQRLQNAGCPVNLTGTDWHIAGDFALATEN